MKKKAAIYFPNLDGLRFFCFLSVFFYHSFATQYPQVSNSNAYKFIKLGIFGNGNLGVNFFFVLSGFLITYLLLGEKQANTKINIPNFYMRRILRIWPLYFCCVFFGFVVFPYLKQLFGQVPHETATILPYLTFTSNFEKIAKGMPDSSMLTVLWSIAVEEQFYVTWPLLLSLVPIKRYNILFATILLGTLFFRTFNDNVEIHESHTLSCIGDMTIGAWGAYLVQNKQWKQRIANWKKWQVLTIYLLFFCIYFFREELLMGNQVTRIFERSFIAVIMLLIILEQNFCENSIFKMGQLKWATNLGIISYGLYCLHFLGILIAATLTKKMHINHSLTQIIFLETAIALAIAIILSKISYKYFENHFLKLKSKFSSTIN